METIVIPSGESKKFIVGPGKSFRNKLIDATADGATLNIITEGNGWEVKCIGVRGAVNSDRTIKVNTDGGSGLIENVYLGDGATHESHAGTRPTAIWTHWEHSGDVTVRNVNAQGWRKGAIAANNPGTPSGHPNDGKGGTVKVEDSYFNSNEIADVRLGSDGSYAENCVMASTIHRGVWGYYGNTSLRNCDVHGHVIVGHNQYGTGAEMELVNTRVGGMIATKTSSDNIIGNSAGEPRSRMPDGVPTSAEQAATCGGRDGKDGSGGDTGDPRNYAEISIVDAAPGINEANMTAEVANKSSSHSLIVEGRMTAAGVPFKEFRKTLGSQSKTDVSGKAEFDMSKDTDVTLCAEITGVEVP